MSPELLCQLLARLSGALLTSAENKFVFVILNYGLIFILPAYYEVLTADRPEYCKEGVNTDKAVFIQWNTGHQPTHQLRWWKTGEWHGLACLGTKDWPLDAVACRESWARCRFVSAVLIGDLPRRVRRACRPGIQSKLMGWLYCKEYVYKQQWTKRRPWHKNLIWMASPCNAHAWGANFPTISKECHGQQEDCERIPAAM